MKLAFVIKGEPDSLKYLNETFNNVVDTLKKYTDYSVKPGDISTIDDLYNLITSCSNESKIEEFLFYYMGHGVINHYDDYERFEYKISEEKKVSLKEILPKIREYIKPNKIFIITDACYSGKIIEDLHTAETTNLYLLSSSSKAELSYEDKNLESTTFSHYFCEAINRANSKTIIEIEEYIKKKLKKQTKKKQTPCSIDPYRIDKTKIVSDVVIEQLPKDSDIYLTVEFIEVDSQKFKFILWAESEDNSYATSELSDDKTYSIEDIPKEVYNFLISDPRYKNIPSDKIILIFVLPKRLMAYNFNNILLTDFKKFGSEYTILYRSQERFRDIGANHKREKYNLANLKANWDNYTKKGNEKIKKIYKNYNNLTTAINARSLNINPLIILNFKPTIDTFEILYQSNATVALWTLGCKNYVDFKKCIDDSNIELKNLHKELYQLQADETELQATTFMLYDNPYKLPLDEEAQIFEIPQ